MTPAQDDKDHIRCIVNNNPKVPSRIKAITEGTGQNPAPEMIDMALRLEKWGADFLVMPCNTAHYYYEDICRAVNIPVANIIELTVEAVLKQMPEIKKVGVIASTAIIITGLYNKSFANRQVEVVYPPDSAQENILCVIKNIKTKTQNQTDSKHMQEAISHLESNGVQAIVIACTELSIIETKTRIPVFDAADILTKYIIQNCKNTQQSNGLCSASP